VTPLSRCTVGVMGSGTVEHDEYARPVGSASFPVRAKAIAGRPEPATRTSRQLVQHFPQPATRVGNISELRRFLQPYVTG
jgi:hypothetical protein